jgi:hypothetical protein
VVGDVEDLPPELETRPGCDREVADEGQIHVRVRRPSGDISAGVPELACLRLRFSR